MAKAMVKCPYCNEFFDRNSISNTKIGRRYYHITCYEQYQNNLTQEDKDEIALYEYIKILYGKKYNYILIKKQIENFHKQGYSFNGMKLSLKWFYEIKHHSVEDSNGIGIIPYVFEDAKKYYYNLYLSQLANAHIKNYSAATRIITIPSPTVYVQPPQLWDLDKFNKESLNEQ